MMQRFVKGLDWSILLAILPLLLGGMATMVSFSEHSTLVDKQLLWVLVGLVVAIGISRADVRFLRDSRYVVLAFGLSLSLFLFSFLSLVKQ